MIKKLCYQNQYITAAQVDIIKKYFDDIGDSPYDSRGPQNHDKHFLGWQGCWDRNLHLEKPDNPVHDIVKKLKSDFGNFTIFECSIRYLCAPFLPHSDIRNPDWFRNMKHQGKKEGWVFLIPLWWEQNYAPGTAFFNCPSLLSDPLYEDHADILPRYAPEYQIEMRNYSVREIFPWKCTGDLIAWENFQFHSSCGHYHGQYDRKKWIKEFISIETWQTD